MLYFAYGSNLNQEQMSGRCPDAKPLGKFTLENWRLVFRGVADIEPHEGSLLMCGLWDITSRDEKNLDRYEGFPRLYRKEEICGLMTYRMNSEEIVPPYDDYFDTILRGYRDFDMEEEPLWEAYQHSWRDQNRLW